MEREGKLQTVQEWVPSTMAEKMRFFEAMENWRATELACLGVSELSRIGGGPHEDHVWAYAATWSLVVMQKGNEEFLKVFGYNPLNEKQWRSSPLDGGPQVKFSLSAKEAHAYHTWYMVECELKYSESKGRETHKWSAPRRLCQLRWDLHDRLKMWMGESYTRHFGGTPFAKLGGPRGTLARLSAWLASLSTAINTGKASPSIAALALHFFQAGELKATEADVVSQQPQGPSLQGPPLLRLHYL